MAVAHFNARLDTWGTCIGAQYTYGTPFRRAAEEGLIDDEACLHVGLRGSVYSRRDFTDDQRLGFAAITSDDAQDGIGPIIERIRERIKDRPMYLSFDIDVLDPAFAPGTGTPEAGGLTPRELLNIVRGMSGMNIVGSDLVEVAPAYDHAQVTGIAEHMSSKRFSAAEPRCGRRTRGAGE